MEQKEYKLGSIVIMKKPSKKEIAPKPKKLSKKELKRLQEEEAAKAKEEAIQAKRTAYLQFNEKELLVEILLALEGYNERISNIEKLAKSSSDDARIAALSSAGTSAQVATSILRSL